MAESPPDPGSLQLVSERRGAARRDIAARGRAPGIAERCEGRPHPLVNHQESRLARQGWARHCKAMHCTAWRGPAWRGTARRGFIFTLMIRSPPGMARYGMAERGDARRGWARRGKVLDLGRRFPPRVVRCGEVWHREAWLGAAGQAGARHGEARRGFNFANTYARNAWQGPGGARRGAATRGTARCGGARPGVAGRGEARVHLFVGSSNNR